MLRIYVLPNRREVQVLHVSQKSLFNKWRACISTNRSLLVSLRLKIRIHGEKVHTTSNCYLH